MSKERAKQKLPSEIYIRKSAISCLSEDKDRIAHAYVEVAKKDYEDWVEYTNLSEKWHNIKTDPFVGSCCGHDIVIVIGIRNGRIAYKFFHSNLKNLLEELRLLTDDKRYSDVYWVHLVDLVPFVKNEGI